MLLVLIRGNRFLLLNMMLPIQLSQMLFYQVEEVSISHLLRDFNQDWVLGFVHDVSTSIEMSQNFSFLVC